MMAEIYLWPDEQASENGVQLFVSQDAVPDGDEAIHRAVDEGYGDYTAEQLRATPILMREIGEVEARIKGYEEQTGYVPCTKRARQAHPYWRVEVTA